MVTWTPLRVAAIVVLLLTLTACEKSGDAARPHSTNSKPTGITEGAPLSAGQAAFQRHDYATALRLWLPLAQNGNANAQVSVGSLYQYGEGVPQDFDEALRWFHLAAKQGSAAGRRSIGFMYENGNGVAQNYSAAFAWYDRAAKQGDPPAQMLLGGMYQGAEGMPQNNLLAYMWFSIAASSSMNGISAASAKFRDTIAASLTKDALAHAQEITRICQQSNYAKCESAEAEESAGSSYAVPMQNVGGIYMVPVEMNGAFTLNFIVDSGATDVSIPADVVMTLFRTGTVGESDFIGTNTYTLADGSTAPSDTFRIKSLKVGNVVLENVVASVGNVRSTPLLGQSFLGRFKSWSIDNNQHALELGSNGESAPPNGAGERSGATPSTAEATAAPDTSSPSETRSNDQPSTVPSNGRASFDCHKVHVMAETMICSDPTLGALDADYAAKWTDVTRQLRSRRAMSQYYQVRDRARAFLARRNECNASTECIVEAYQEIIQYLASVR